MSNRRARSLRRMREREAVAHLDRLAAVALDVMGLLLTLSDACEREDDARACLTAAAQLGEAIQPSQASCSIPMYLTHLQ